MEFDWLDELLDGIDKDECDYDGGWWETSTGASFGAEKLAELKAEIERRYGHLEYRAGAELVLPWNEEEI